MGRSKEILEIAAESKRILKKRHQLNKELAMTSLKMLYTHHDSVDHSQLDLANDFANLPTEVVHDVIELASFEDEKVAADLQKLSLINGSWAEFGNEFATADRSLRMTTVDSRSDFNELKASAPQLCGQINLFYAPNQFYEIFELMGTRFSSIEWSANENFSPLASLQVSRFLKRQLKSTRLRRLIICAKIDSDLDDLIVEFVQRPHFERLVVGGDNLLPFQLFEEAHKSWESQVPQNSPLDNKEIYATTSQHASAKKFKAHFVEDRVCLKHPVHSKAKAYLRVRKDSQECCAVEMILESLAERSGCIEKVYVPKCVDSH